jgi:hypothetical protein
VDIQRLSFEGDEPASATLYLPHLARMRIGGFAAEMLKWEVLHSTS